jgi:iron complex outermembrane recepter protein
MVYVYLPCRAAAKNDTNGKCLIFSLQKTCHSRRIDREFRLNFELYFSTLFCSMKFFFLYLLLVSVYCSAFPQNTTSISGKITSDGKPVARASVSLLNTHLGTTSDNEGSFKLDNVPDGKYNLSITAVGYASVVRNVVSGKENQVLNIELAASVNQLDEVVVTAQKTEEALQKIPLAISSISAGQIQEYRLWNSKDITAIVPNLYAGNSGDERNVTSLRGVATTSYDPAVATYIDGVNQFSLDTYIAQLIDVERIEVLRGPQGTLYGRNAMGGVINIITKQPTNLTTGFVEINFGSYGQQRYALGIRTPVIKDKLFLGVSGVFEKRDGFYINKFNNSAFEQFQNTTGNYYLKYLLNSKLSFTFNLKHANNTNKGAFPLAFGRSAFEDPFVVSQNAIAKTIDNTLNASLSANYFGAGFNFSSITAYQSNYRYYQDPIDADFTPLDGISIINNYGKDWNKAKVLTQEFKFSSSDKLSSLLKWTAGLYSFYQENPVKQTTRFGTFGKDFGAQDSLTSIRNSGTGFNFGIAFYGQVAGKITDQIEVFAGLRFDYEAKRQSALSEFLKDKFQNPIFIIRSDTSTKAEFHAFSPKLGLNYKITDNSLAYFSYSVGFRAGGITQVQPDPSQPPLYIYKPEYSNNLEIGTKNTLWNNKLKLNGNLFYTDITNAQIPTLVLPQALTITKNAGSLTNFGAELETSVFLIKGLQADYNFGLTNSKFTSLQLPNKDGNAEINYNGNHQIFTPNITSMLALQYSYELNSTQKLQLVVRGEWRYLGKQYFDLQNTISQPDYSVLNARLGVSARNFEVMLWGRNLSNEKYIEYAYSFGGIHLGNPFNYGITLTGRF